jgi:hypothetical protein
MKERRDMQGTHTHTQCACCVIHTATTKLIELLYGISQQEKKRKEKTFSECNSRSCQHREEDEGAKKETRSGAE